MALYDKGKQSKRSKRTYYNDMLHKDNWSTGDMFVTLCAGIAIGTTIGILFTYAMFDSAVYCDLLKTIKD